MSSEQHQTIDRFKVNKTKGINLPNIRSQQKKVNINHLMIKVRESQKKDKKDNLVFFGIIGSVVAVTGIIISL